MNLLNTVQTDHPLIWVVSDEPGKVYSLLSKSSLSSKLLRYDGVKGLLAYVAEDDRWGNVTVMDPEFNQYTIINNLPESLMYAIENKHSLIIDNAHTFADKILDVCVSLHNSYRDMVLLNDASHRPAQLIMISHEHEPPREIARYASICSIGLPDDKELSYLYMHFVKESRYNKDYNDNFFTAKNRVDDFVRAARGLSESEVIETCVNQTNESGLISIPEVNRYKLELLKNNGILEVRNPEAGSSEIGGLDNAKSLLERIKYSRTSSRVKSLGVKPINKILLIGVPGSGKSLFCEAAANALNLDLAKGGISSSMSKWVGQSEENTRRMFATLNRMSPVVFWIDEFGRDMSGSQSSASVDGGTTDRVHGEFLTGIQELDDEILLVAAANRIQDLPPEMTRADRFDKVMFVGFPTLEERVRILEIHLGVILKDYPINVKTIAEATDMFTGAEIKSLINEVKFEHATDPKLRNKPLETRHFVEKVPTVKGRIWINHRQDMVDMYTRALDEWDWASSGQQEDARRVLELAKNPSASYSPKKPATQGTRKAKWG